LLDGGQATVVRDAGLLGDEGRAALVLAARRRPAREGRYSLQRRDARGDRDEVLARVAAGRPLGRLAEPGEIADVIVFLLSPRASYVTGAAWSADGGTVPVII